MGEDVGSGCVCFDFRATNVVHLSMSLWLPKDHRGRPVTKPESRLPSMYLQT